MHNGSHYHQGYANSDYERGLRDGRADASRNMPWNVQNRQYRTQQERQQYEAGYNDGYRNRTGNEVARQKPGYYGYPNNGGSGYPNNGGSGYPNNGASI